MAKLEVHHLNNSRSQRVLWLLEELRLPYEVERYERDKKTSLAPPELQAIHPLGKSPVIADGDVTVACWEPGQISPYHCHPFATEIYFCFSGGGTMRTPLARISAS